MASCLGIYVEQNLIKYAKVSKEKETIKVESFGVKTYENLSETIEKIIEETYSYKIPISINLSRESYAYFDMFALMTKKDLDKAIKTEFEMTCNEKGYNANVLESRYAMVPNVAEKQKLRIIYISQNKIELNNQKQEFERYSLRGIFPIAMSIPCIAHNNIEDNCLIVNLEEKTVITKIIDKNIYYTQMLPVGSKNVLDKINSIENSYSKSYDICKNTTIYTSEGKELEEIDTNHLEDIMPTLYEIAQKIMKMINESEKKITKIYITGTLSLINNVDLYFQEYLADVECELLKPSFITPNANINIKDYIEVNTPISMALTFLGEGLRNINFKKVPFSEKLKILNSDVSLGQKNKGPKVKKVKETETFNNKDLKLGTISSGKLDFIEKGMIRVAYALILIIVAYFLASYVIYNQIQDKTKEAKAMIQQITTQINKAKSDETNFRSKEKYYIGKIDVLEKIEARQTDIDQNRNQIPNLLQHIMHVVPAGVQITSIQNTTGEHIKIELKSNKYEQIGYFAAKIKEDVILKNVISSSGQNSAGVVNVKIEGDLP